MADIDVAVEKSTTSEISNNQGKDCTVGKFISEDDGWKIVAAAATWEGTPYSLVGGSSVKGKGGDCSGTTNKSFVEAGFPYPYQSTANFASYAKSSNRFREIDRKKDAMQAGDVLLWPGHMAIYAPFPEGHPKRDTGVIKGGKKKANDMYTAFNSRTDTPYGPYNIETFRGDAYRVYRYYILPVAQDAKK
jgi:hypothetical protein